MSARSFWKRGGMIPTRVRGVPFKDERAANHGCIQVEPLAPEVVAHHENWRRARLPIFRRYSPAEQRRYAQELKSIGSHQPAPEQLRAFAVPIMHLLPRAANHSVENVILFLIIQKLRDRQPTT